MRLGVEVPRCRAREKARLAPPTQAPLALGFSDESTGSPWSCNGGR